jgi:hypothetical protein
LGSWVRVVGRFLLSKDKSMFVFIVAVIINFNLDLGHDILVTVGASGTF